MSVNSLNNLVGPSLLHFANGWSGPNHGTVIHVSINFQPVYMIRTEKGTYHCLRLSERYGGS